MSASNRFLNRFVLALFGIALITLGAAALLLVTRPDWAAGATAAGERAFAATADALGQRQIVLSDQLTVPLSVVLASVIALVIVVLLLVFLGTRGGGRISEVLQRSADNGKTDVDVSVVDQVLGARLRERPDVLRVTTQLFSVKGEPTIRLAITPRRGADLAVLVSATERAIEEWDGVLGAAVPLIVHLRDRGAVAARRSPSRVR